MKRPLLSLAVVSVVVIAAGCGGGGGGSSVSPGSLPTAQSYWPLKVGNVWQYELINAPTTTADATPVDRTTHTIVGTQVINNDQWFEDQVESWHSSAGPSDPNATTTTVLLRETTAGLYYYDSVSQQALPFIDKTATMGGSWGSPGGLPYTWDLTDTNASITVSAGTFDGCWQIFMHVPQTGAQDQLWERWFKQGVGMLLERYWSDPQTPIDDQSLLSYTVAP